MPLLKQIKILSFDPGLTCLGWATSIYDTEKDILEVQKYGGLKASKIASKNKELSEIYGSRILALKEIESQVSKLVKSFDPDYVASEDAFFYPKSPNAFGALLMCIYTIQRTLFYEYEQFKTIKESARTLYKFAPRNIKIIASGNSLSFKGNMLTALAQNNQIAFKTKDDVDINELINSLSEHEVDAISCGFTFVKTSLPAILCE